MKNLDGKTEEDTSEQSKASISVQSVVDEYDARFAGSNPEITIKDWNSYIHNLEEPAYTTPGL